MPIPLFIAIDGPAAVGKSTVGKLLAQKQGYRFVDTGMMYRAVTWQALRKKVDWEDGEALSRLARETSIDLSGAENRVLVNGQDVTLELREPLVEAYVSQVSRFPGVREAMVAQQRRLAKEGRVVMVGRDIGTAVLPDAGLKVFLEASLEERAHRRYNEQKERGEEVNYPEVLAELRRRDEIDSHRDISPLRPAPDARIVPTEGRSPEEVVREILDVIKERLCV